MSSTQQRVPPLPCFLTKEENTPDVSFQLEINTVPGLPLLLDFFSVRKGVDYFDGRILET